MKSHPMVACLMAMAAVSTARQAQVEAFADALIKPPPRDVSGRDAGGTGIPDGYNKSKEAGRRLAQLGKKARPRDGGVSG